MVLSTRISVLHRILVPRSEVRLLGGQQNEAASAALIVESKNNFLLNAASRVMGYTVLSNTKQN